MVPESNLYRRVWPRTNSQGITLLVQTFANQILNVSLFCFYKYKTYFYVDAKVN